MTKEKRKIALYGLGTETEKAILKLRNENEIVGLLDGFRTDGMLYGKPIISIDDAIAKGVNRIIVVARPGSCKAIEKRIGNICRDHTIELFDVRGKNLLNQDHELYSARQMQDIVQQAQEIYTVSDEVKTNLFCNRIRSIVNDTGSLVIRDAFDIGYLFCAPMITDFVLWLYEKTREESVKNMWFSARDGYLIKKLFEILDPAFESTYFLTSRTAAIRAGVCNEDDLRYVDSMKFSGTVAENLWARFGIDVEDKEDVRKELLDYKEIVIKKAESSRKGYQHYIDTLNLKAGNIAMFDFVAKGTSQYFIGKLVPNHIKGFYFLQLEPDFMQDKNLDIEPFYTDAERNTSAIFDNYYILETILTSPDSSVVDFMPEGIPVYTDETRDQTDIECFLNVQNGIIAYFKDFLHNCPVAERSVNKKLDEEFLKLIHNVDIQDKAFISLTVEDPFFNRMTAITDVL